MRSGVVNQVGQTIGLSRLGLEEGSSVGTHTPLAGKFADIRSPILHTGSEPGPAFKNHISKQSRKLTYTQAQDRV